MKVRYIFILIFYFNYCLLDRVALQFYFTLCNNKILYFKPYKKLLETFENYILVNLAWWLHARLLPPPTHASSMFELEAPIEPFAGSGALGLPDTLFINSLSDFSLSSSR